MDGYSIFAAVTHPSAIVAMSDHLLLFVDGPLLRNITDAAEVRTIVGRSDDAEIIDGLLSNARFLNLVGITIGIDGAVYVAETNCIRMISTTGIAIT